MKIYDISQEVFSCAVYPGDPIPERILLMQKSEGGVCNLTAFRMCAHNGTHIDAPFHFIDNGRKIDEISPEAFTGWAYVAAHEGEMTAEDAEGILEKAYTAEKKADIACSGASERILIKGQATVTEEAAKVFATHRILLFGNESQTVGPEDAPKTVHEIMLGSGIILLEGIRLRAVEDGIYFLSAAPLNLSGADGSPCRALLITP